MEVGYFGSSCMCGGDNFGADTADHTSIGWCAWRPEYRAPEINIEHSLQQIRGNAAHGKKVILDVSFLCWETAWLGGAWTLDLCERHFNDMEARIKAEGLWPSILSFYPMDEPFHNAWTAGNNDKQRFANNLRAVCEWLERRWPDKFRIVTFCDVELNAHHPSQIPTGVEDGLGFDAVGLDSYIMTTLGKHEDDYRRLIHNLQWRFPMKPIYIVGDGALFPGFTIEETLARVRWQYRIAKEEGAVALIWYAWNDQGAMGQHRGAKHVPELLELLKQIGRKETGKAA